MHSFLAQYLTQTCLHAAIAALMVEVLIKSWGIADPRVRSRLRSLVLLVPAFGFPVFHLIDTARGDPFFRSHIALFDSWVWMRVRLLGPIRGSEAFLALLGVTTFVFLVQEFGPTIADLFHRERKIVIPSPEARMKLESAIASASHFTSSRLPPITFTASESPTAYFASLLHPRLVLSLPLLEMLNEQELTAVLGHELAHRLRRDVWRQWLLALIRVPQFYNPVTLFVFRRIVQDLEMTCDRYALSWTREVEPYRSSLSKLARLDDETSEDTCGEDESPLLVMRSQLHAHSQRCLAQERLKGLRVVEKGTGGGVFEALRFGLLTFVVLALCFFVV